jgi:hypothetical protein
MIKICKITKWINPSALVQLLMVIAILSSFNIYPIDQHEIHKGYQHKDHQIDNQFESQFPQSSKPSPQSDLAHFDIDNLTDNSLEDSLDDEDMGSTITFHLCYSSTQRDYLELANFHIEPTLSRELPPPKA